MARDERPGAMEVRLAICIEYSPLYRAQDEIDEEAPKMVCSRTRRIIEKRPVFPFYLMKITRENCPLFKLVFRSKRSREPIGERNFESHIGVA